MKKIIALSLAVFMLFTLTACGGNKVEEVPTNIELCAEHSVEKLKSILKNPNSLIVNNLSAVEADDYYIFKIDYSAQNGFGGMDRDDFFLAVFCNGDSFSFKTYGTGSFDGPENQKYSSQFFTKYDKISGTYILNTQTYKVEGKDVSNVDNSINKRVTLVGKMDSPCSESSGFNGAWNFELNGDTYLKVVYFTDGTDLEWYKQFTGLPYEITISAIKDEDGHYQEAEIIEDNIRYATFEERLERLNYYDKKILPDVISESEYEAMSSDNIRTALNNKTFSIRGSKVGENVDSVTFNSNGILDAYTSNEEEYDLYDSWKVEDNTIVFKDTYEHLGEVKTNEEIFAVYQIDSKQILLVSKDNYASNAMILTANV